MLRTTEHRRHKLDLFRGPFSQSYGFSSSHVWMWELDYKESWAPKNWCFWTVALEKTLESPLDCKEVQLVILKDISPRCSLEGLMLKLKLQYFSHLIQRAHSLEKPNAGKDWRQEEKGTTEEKMVRWHHWLNGHDFERTPGDSEGQGSLVCCSPWGCKDWDTTEQQRKIWNVLQVSLTKSFSQLSDHLEDACFHYHGICWPSWSVMNNNKHG